jgi:hypothetical protein
MLPVGANGGGMGPDGGGDPMGGVFPDPGGCGLEGAVGVRDASLQATTIARLATMPATLLLFTKALLPIIRKVKSGTLCDNSRAPRRC